jgi:hypothetical protein
MIDTNALLRKWLLTSDDLVALLLDRDSTKSIYAGDLPEKVDPKDGPAVVISTRPGKMHKEIPVLITPNFQIRVWAAPMKYKLARQVYGVISDLIHGANNIDLAPDGYVLMGQANGTGQDVDDPDSGDATVIGFFDVMMRPSS